MRCLLLTLLLLLAVPAAAHPREPEWRQSTEHQVLVRLNAFEPEEIRLVAGQPTRLVFHNGSRSLLSLQAGSFFRNARLRSGDAEMVADGGLVLRPGESRAISLVPASGRYRLRSGSRLRRLIGMSAVIVVEAPGRTAGELTGR